jgi:hypothetical protein
MLLTGKGLLPLTGSSLRHPTGVVFASARVVVCAPGIHQSQRDLYVEHLNQQRKNAGLAVLTDTERLEILGQGVDLFFRPGPEVLIRPESGKELQALDADEFLRARLALDKTGVKFWGDSRSSMRRVLSGRCETWRCAALPRSTAEIIILINESLTPLASKVLYYHQVSGGVRYLTYAKYAELRYLKDGDLAQALNEIRMLCVKKSEISFFGAGTGGPPFSRGDFIQVFDATGDNLRHRYAEIDARFSHSVSSMLKTDDTSRLLWRNAMASALLGSAAQTEEEILGLAMEYHHHLLFVPAMQPSPAGLVPETIPPDSKFYDALAPQVASAIVKAQPSPPSFVNVARVEESLSEREKEPNPGRREVYFVHLGTSDSDTRHFIVRFSKWDVSEKLKAGERLETAVASAANYEEFCLDRHAGARLLGMNVPPIRVGRAKEVYMGHAINSTFFFRQYFDGVSSNKLPAFQAADYAERYFRIMGAAAAANAACARNRFGDGDEVIGFDQAGLPATVTVVDPTGCFFLWRDTLASHADLYAKEIFRHTGPLTAEQVRACAGAFITSFIERYKQIRSDVRNRADEMRERFKERILDPNGSSRARFERMLQAVSQTEPLELERALWAAFEIERPKRRP